MSFVKSFLAVALALSFGAAHATLTESTSGSTTTYDENFDEGTSFSAGWYNAASTDDYLYLGNSTTSSYTFSSAVALSSVTISFWYSAESGIAGTVAGRFRFGSEDGVNLADNATGAQLNCANPGADSTQSCSTFDTKYSITYTNVAAGSYKMNFYSNQPESYNLYGLKVDDLQVTMVAAGTAKASAMSSAVMMCDPITAAVPEPEIYAMMLAGLGVIGLIARRRASRRN